VRLLFHIEGSGIGGNETLLASLIPSLQLEGHSCVVVACQDLALRYFQPLTPNICRLTNPNDWPGILDRYSPDITIGFHGEIFSMASASKQRGISTVWVIGHPPSESGSGNLVQDLGSVLFDKVIFQSEFLKRDLVRDLGTRGTVISNGICTEKFSARFPAERLMTRSLLGFSNDDFIVGFSARLRAYKDHSYLFEAFRTVKEKLPNAKLLLLTGISPATESFLLSDENAEIISLSVYPEHVPQFLGAMDVFAFPSVREGMGCALLEAIALEIPVVARASGGPEEILNTLDVGKLIRGKDPKAFGAAILSISKNLRAHRSALKIRREKLVRVYGAQRMRSDYSKVFREVFHERSSRALLNHSCLQ
jgi:glycosyltransferase involved in cell wall biosynthesis